MREIRVEVTSRTDGETREATLTVCPRCNGETFYVSAMTGHDGRKHAHLQCAQCGETYCGLGDQCR